MRKLIRTILILLLALSLAVPVSAAYAEDFMGRSCVANIDGADLSGHYEEIAQIPDCILRRFVNRGWSYVIDSQRCIDWGIEDDLGFIPGGVTYFEEKEIVIRTESTIIHEFGHFLHALLGRGWEPELKELYQLEAEQAAEVLGDYCTTDWCEYFADSFDYYVRHHHRPWRMKRFEAAAPETYAYFVALERNGWSRW